MKSSLFLVLPQEKHPERLGHVHRTEGSAETYLVPFCPATAKTVTGVGTQCTLIIFTLKPGRELISSVI